MRPFVRCCVHVLIGSPILAVNAALVAYGYCYAVASAFVRPASVR